MNLWFKKQLFLYNFYHNTGIKSYLQRRASTLEGFSQPSKSQPFLPLSGAFLYNPIAETTELESVTSRHQALTVQGVDYRHILQI